MFLTPIGSSRQLPNQPLPYQSLTFGTTLYKLIVKGLLGLDSVRRWARSENPDPTSTIQFNLLFNLFFTLCIILN